MATVYERIRNLVIKQLGIKDDRVTAASSLSDLGADSLDMVELVMAVESEFTTDNKKLSIPDEEMEKFSTVQDIVEFVKKQGFTDYQQQPRYSNQNKESSRFNPRNRFHHNNDNKQNNQQNQENATENTPNNSSNNNNGHRYYRRYSNRNNRTYRSNNTENKDSK